MQSKLSELTEKIYQEGITKALTESEKIIADAKKEAHQIIENARNEAEKIINSANKEATETISRTHGEIQLSAKQMFSDLKQQLMKVIETKSIQTETQKSFNNIDFTGNLIQTLVQNWNPNEGQNVDLNILLPEVQKNEFEQFFKNKAQQVLQSGCTIEYTGKIKAGFQVTPKDGGYIVSMTDEDFNALFTSYLRPKLINLLFEK